jgi:hypothetical protein
MPKQNKKGFPKKASDVVKSLISVMVSLSLSIRPVSAQGYGRSNSENNAIFRTLSTTEKKQIVETEIIVIPERNKNSSSFGKVEESKKLPFKVFKGNKEIDLTTLKNKLEKKSPDIGKGRILGENIVDYTETFSKLLKNELESVIEQKVYQNIEEEEKLQLIQKNDFELLQKERFYANVEKAKNRIQEYKLQLVQETKLTKNLNRDLVNEVNKKRENLLKDLENLNQGMDSKVIEDLYDEINNVRFYNDLLKLNKLLIVGGFIGMPLPVGKSIGRFILSKIFGESKKDRKKKVRGVLDDIFTDDKEEESAQKIKKTVGYIGLILLLIRIINTPLPIPKPKPPIFFPGPKEKEKTIGELVKETVLPKKERHTLSSMIVNNFFFLFNTLKMHYPKLLVVLILTALMNPNVRSFITSRTPQSEFVDRTFRQFENFGKMIQKAQDQTFNYMKTMNEYFRKANENYSEEQKDALKIASQKLEKLTKAFSDLNVDSALSQERLQTCTNELTSMYDESVKVKSNYDTLLKKLYNEYKEYIKLGGTLTTTSTKSSDSQKLLVFPKMLEELQTETKVQTVNQPSTVINVGKKKNPK